MSIVHENLRLEDVNLFREVYYHKFSEIDFVSNILQENGKERILVTIVRDKEDNKISDHVLVNPIYLNEQRELDGTIKKFIGFGPYNRSWNFVLDEMLVLSEIHNNFFRELVHFGEVIYNLGEQYEKELLSCHGFNQSEIIFVLYLEPGHEMVLRNYAKEDVDFEFLYDAK